ncbi:MAG: type II toxin-antitoxin system VapC family toxin [Chloroflexi bacterium]|nr:type II toxin-antitoxin system VapC family toxin [Chloroflexota bacterium]
MPGSTQIVLQNAIQQGVTLCLDTNCLLYYFSGHQPWADNLQPVFEAREQGKIRLVTSTITLAEVLARAADNTQASQLLDTIRRYFEIIPVSDQTGIYAGGIRQGSSIKTPDAVEMATALDTGATLFITNDEQLIRAPQPAALYLKDLALDWLEDEFSLCIDTGQPVVTLPAGSTILNLSLTIDPDHPLSPLSTPLAATEFPLLALKLSQLVAGPAAVVGLIEAAANQEPQLTAIGLMPTGRPWVMPVVPNWVGQFTNKTHTWQEHEPRTFVNRVLDGVKQQPDQRTLFLLADISRLEAEASAEAKDANRQMLSHRKRIEMWKHYLAPFRPLTRLWLVDRAQLWRGEAGNAHPINLNSFTNFFKLAEDVLGRDGLV